MQAQIGSKIRQLRKQRGLSQTNLADRAHLSSNFVSLIERDLQSPTLDSIIRISYALGMSTISLFAELMKSDKEFALSLCEANSSYHTDRNKWDILTAEIESFFILMSIDELESLCTITKSICKKGGQYFPATYE